MPADTHVHCTSISLLKQQLKTIQHNIATLEQQLDSGSNFLYSDDLKEQTRQLLREVDQACKPTKLQRIIAKRKRTRLLKKIKKKRQKQTVVSLQQSTTTATLTVVDTSVAPTSFSQAHKRHHQQLRNCYNAQQMLRRFELLEKLHLARGADAEATQRFAAQFSHLRTIWNTVLSENLPHRTKERKIEEQWDEVFFGPNDPVYYGREHKIGDIVRIRRTWDTYLTRNKKRGSCIPMGWIVPSAEATPAWQKYRATNTTT